MSTDLKKLSTSQLEAELQRRKDNETLLRHVENALSALSQGDLVIRLEAGSGTLQEKLGYGRTTEDMRALLADGMRTALLARKEELEAE
jgi:hypothetical protein